MTELLYNAKSLSEIIKKPNIITFINRFLTEMAKERYISISVPLSDFGKNDIISAKKLLEENGFKVVLMKDPDYSELFHSMIIAIPKI